MKRIFSTISLVFINVMLYAQNGCPNFTTASSLPVKVVVYTEAEECFMLTYNGEVINQEPSQRVIFYMNYEVGNATMKMTDGQEVEKKIIVTNTAMASVTYEIVKNEKKGTFDVKNRIGQGQMTAEAQKQQQDDVAARMEASKKKQAEEQKARDDAWDAQLKKKEDERKMQESALKSETQPSDIAQPGENANGGRNANTNSEQTATGFKHGKDEFPYRFTYNGIPIRERIIRADYRDTENRMMGGQSDNTGLVVFQSDLPYGVYKVDFRFNPTDNTTISKLAYTVVLGDHEGKIVEIDFKEYVEAMAEMMGYDFSTMESLLGFDKVK